MIGLLILAAVVISVCIFLNNSSRHIGVTVLLSFTLLGMIFSGSGAIPAVNAENVSSIQDICCVALIFIMFQGGFATNWRKARPVLTEAAVLSTLGVILTALITSVFCHYVLRWNWTEALLIGSVISSTDAASIFSIFRSRKLCLKKNTASLTEIECGSNGSISYMITIILLAIFNGEASSAFDVALKVIVQLVLGIIFGLVISTIAVMVMRRAKFKTAGFNSLFIIAIAIISYAVPAVMGGNGYLSVYIVGLVLGNVEFDNRRELVRFFDGFSGMMQVAIFFILGLMSSPSSLQDCFIPAAGIFLVLLLLARPITLALLLLPFRVRDEKWRNRGKYGFRQQMMMSFLGLRGTGSIVFAIIATVGFTYEYDIFNTVFCLIVLSLGIQGPLIPSIAKGLNMTDENEDVMKTFNDYTRDLDLQFSKVIINSANPWCGKQVRDLSVPADFLLCLVIKQDGSKAIPTGSTIFEEGDEVMVCSKTYHGNALLNVSRHKLPDDSKWEGRTISEIGAEYNTQLLMIQRNNEEIIPHGNTVVMPGDILYFNEIVSSSRRKKKKS